MIPLVSGFFMDSGKQGDGKLVITGSTACG
jgi:hypothetical protein